MVKLRKPLLFACAAAAVLFAAPAGQAMVLSSSGFHNGGQLPAAQVHSRCGGEDRSPALDWSGAPANTQSYALTLFDPDANHGHGFWHWIAFDIPPTTSSLGEGAEPPQGALQTDNDFGDRGFGGACPPPGPPHHYQFTLFALDAAKAPFGEDAKPAEAVAWFKSHTLATATLVAIYRR